MLPNKLFQLRYIYELHNIVQDREVRNAIMHSNSMKLSRTNLTKYKQWSTCFKIQLSSCMTLLIMLKNNVVFVEDCWRRWVVGTRTTCNVWGAAVTISKAHMCDKTGITFRKGGQSWGISDHTTFKQYEGVRNQFDHIKQWSTCF